MRVVKQKVSAGGSYFAAPKANYQFIPSGCQILDLALGGGWAEDHVANIVGDRSTGKTLLCIEACANFARKYSKGRIKYRECEASFDTSHAEALGMPLDRIDFGDDALETVEDLYNDMDETVTKAKDHTLYIVDSLDALGDVADKEREITQGSYGGNKPKIITKFFRDFVKPMRRKHITLIVVSQVRSVIGFGFGKTIQRTGGKALGHHVSQELWLYYTGQYKPQVGKIVRTAGIEIKAKVEKNKIGLPWRDAAFRIRFGYGIDDTLASQYWMKKHGGKWPATPEQVAARWYEVEKSFMPEKRKYAG